MKTALGHPDDPLAPLDRLKELARQRREIEAQEEIAVRQARLRSISWAAIGSSMGVSRQAAHKRFALRRFGDR